MKRVINKARSHKDAGEWDIAQQVKLTPGQRQEISRELKDHFFGTGNPDVRDSRAFTKRARKTE